MAFTREQVDAIEIGVTKIAAGIDGRFGEATPVLSIYGKGLDVKGRLFVCGYRRFGFDAMISFSIKEGDDLDGRTYRIE